MNFASCSHVFASILAEFPGREDSGWVVFPNRTTNPGPAREPVGNVQLVPLDRHTPENSTRPIEMVRLDSTTRPTRETVNQIVGWTPGNYRIVLLAQEIDNTHARPDSTLLTRLGHQLLIRPAIATGIVQRRHLHVSVAFIDETGNWFRANPKGPLSPIAQGSFLNQNVSYLPLELPNATAAQVAGRIRDSIGQRSPFGCANASCQMVSDGIHGSRSVLPGQSNSTVPATAGYNFDQILNQGTLPVRNIYVTGTHVDSFQAFHQGMQNADWNVAFPLILSLMPLGL